MVCNLWRIHLGGEVKSADNREFGKTPTKVDTTSPLFKGLDEDQVVWMSHVDYVAKVPEGFEIIAHTKDCPVASMQNKERKLYAMQYHAEVLHTEHGKEMLHNFLYEVCGFTASAKRVLTLSICAAAGLGTARSKRPQSLP